MKHLLFSLCFITTFLSCNNETDTCVYAYVGGEIINPNSDFLILNRNNGQVDTLVLDENNRFFKKIENLQPGIHNIIHGGEYQILVLEANDSVMVRLNTLDFDESIVYTGVGAKKNNYLIKMSLDIEIENDKMLEWSKQDPKTFSKSVVQQKELRLEHLDRFAAKHQTSLLFNQIAEASIKYNFYANKEMYPFRYFGDYKIKKYTTLPKDFYNYRADIDYNSHLLKDIYPYYNFLFSHFNNLALDTYFAKNNDSVFKRRSLAFNMERIKLMDSLVKNDSIKNFLLKYAVRDFINYSKNPTETDTLINSYLSFSSNKDHKAYIKQLAEALKNLQPGKTFPEISLIRPDGMPANLNMIIDKPTVLSFWSSAVKSHFKDNHKRIQELRVRYPNIDFISININANNSNVWKQTLRRYKFPLRDEYKFKSPQEAKRKLALNYINKVFLIDKDHVIINPNANMFNLYFEDQLADLSQ
jgi:hypothetical protein